MVGQQLGKLSSVDARTIWTHEAQQFTPWLRENSNLLGEALGMDIEITASEAAVGDFAVDLLETDIGNNRPLIVENQLEPTDHRHLGQLITYAAGLDAGAIVWVTPQFRDEHRQALDWLNAHTSEGIDFFGMEIELLKIDDSLPAPHFKLVAQPNGWAKTARLAASTQPSEVSLRRQEFLQAVLDEVRRHLPGLTDRARAGANNWLSINAGRKGFSVVTSFADGRRLRVQLYIDTGNTAANKASFDALAAQRASIETKLGADLALSWERRDGQPTSRVAAYRPGSTNDPPEQLAELQEWAIETTIRFAEVLRPIIGDLEPLPPVEGESESEEGTEP